LFESSGNTCLHYAAAYGWYFCLVCLMNGGARLDVLNEWKLSPLAVAYLKGITNQKVNSNITNLVVVNSLLDLVKHYVQIQRYYPKIMVNYLK
jgi:hypothetical protein